jgi:phosphoribosylaminoimidazole-succinocarboxamide synthase
MAIDDHHAESNGKSIHAIPLPLVRSGKVREVYRVPEADGTTALPSVGTSAADGSRPEGRLLIVASDRISAFDVIMPTPITGKGKLLTQMATFWLKFIEQQGICQTHLVGTKVSDLPAHLGLTREHAQYLDGRMMLTRACDVIPIECVVRGYLEGSGWKEYRESGTVCGIKLPSGLRQCDKLPEPIFTPATKEATGHDQNISFDHAADLVGLETMSILRDMSLKIYQAASAHALARGIIIADTKFEFGLPEGSLMRAARVWEPPILIDEALTPDSSRFWPADDYQPGRSQKSFDKQFLREWLETQVEQGLWNKQPPGPSLPQAVVQGTLARYQQALDVLTK